MRDAIAKGEIVAAAAQLDKSLLARNDIDALAALSRVDLALAASHVGFDKVLLDSNFRQDMARGEVAKYTMDRAER